MQHDVMPETDQGTWFNCKFLMKPIHNSEKYERKKDIWTHYLMF